MRYESLTMARERSVCDIWCLLVILQRVSDNIICQSHAIRPVPLALRPIHLNFDLTSSRPSPLSAHYTRASFAHADGCYERLGKAWERVSIPLDYQLIYIMFHKQYLVEQQYSCCRMAHTRRQSMNIAKNQHTVQ